MASFTCFLINGLGISRDFSFLSSSPENTLQAAFLPSSSVASKRGIRSRPQHQKQTFNVNLADDSLGAQPAFLMLFEYLIEPQDPGF